MLKLLRPTLVALLVWASNTALHAGVPTEPAKRAEIIGKPQTLVVEPATLTLKGPRAHRQLLVTGKYGDGNLRDLTALCDYTIEGGVALETQGGFLLPVKNGNGAIVVRAGGLSVRVPITVSDFDKPQPISFRNELIAALNVGGCNSGACHGTPSGKNGFRLSLRGYDPDADHVQLTRDVLARRTDRHNPEASLIYQKAIGGVPHEGGQRYQVGSIPARVMRAWLAEGLQDDPRGPLAVSIQVLPGSRVSLSPGRFQQLTVLAKFSDGSIRDVTRLVNFSSSDPAVADVTPTGLVEFTQAGEVAILCRYLEIMETVRFTYLEPRKDFKWPNPPENNFVDRHVFAKLKMLNITPSELCSDEDFIRRAYLDLCGILPSAEAVRSFLADRSKDKRAKLIDRLLESEEYADFWTLKWSDVLRSNRKTIQLKGIHVFQRWLRKQIADNVGFDETVRALLTATGSTYSNPPANYYRITKDPTSLAETTAQLFFGVRMACAKCHNHPFERWTQDDYYSLAAFFARVKTKPDPANPGPNRQTPGSEIVFTLKSGEVTQPRSGKVMAPKVMGRAAPVIPSGENRLAVLAQLVTDRDNPFFAKSTVNRIWYHLMARGIVDPVDDFRDSNPSANDELLDALAKEFVAKKFDVKHIIRVIMNSRTYQLSAQTNDFNKDDNKYFSHAYTRLLPAEPLLDAICTATDVPEKFAGLPLGTRAVQLPDGEVNHPFLKIFGQPARELACECEREGDSNLSQALQLINGPTVNGKLREANNRLGKLLARKIPEKQMLEELYLATLSRYPAEEEVKAALEHVAKAQNKRLAWEDVHWALINSKEFLFRH